MVENNQPKPRTKELFQYFSETRNDTGAPLFAGDEGQFTAALQDPRLSRKIFDKALKSQAISYENSDAGYEKFKSEYLGDTPLQEFTPEKLISGEATEMAKGMTRYIESPTTMRFNNTMVTLRQESEAYRAREARMRELTQGPQVYTPSSDRPNIVVQDIPGQQPQNQEDFELPSIELKRTQMENLQYETAAKRTSVLVGMANEGPTPELGVGVFTREEQDKNKFAGVDNLIEEYLIRSDRPKSASYFKSKVKTAGATSDEAFQDREKYLTSAIKDINTNEAEIATLYPKEYEDYRTVTEQLGPYMGEYIRLYQKVSEQIDPTEHEKAVREMDAFAEANNLNAVAATYNNLLTTPVGQSLSNIDNARNLLHNATMSMNSDEEYKKYNDKVSTETMTSEMLYYTRDMISPVDTRVAAPVANKILGGIQGLVGVVKVAGDLVNPDEYTSFDKKVDAVMNFFDPQKNSISYLPSRQRRGMYESTVTLPSGAKVTVNNAGGIEGVYDPSNRFELQGKVKEAAIEEFVNLPEDQRGGEIEVNYSSVLSTSVSTVAEVFTLAGVAGKVGGVTNSKRLAQATSVGYYTAQGMRDSYEEAVNSLGDENRRLAAVHAVISGGAQGVLSTINPMELNALPAHMQFRHMQRQALKRADRIIKAGGSNSVALRSAQKEFYALLNEGKDRAIQYGKSVLTEGVEGALESGVQESLNRATNMAADMMESGSTVGERIKEQDMTSVITRGFIEEMIGGMAVAGFKGGKNRTVLDREAMGMAYNLSPKDRELLIQGLRTRGDNTAANRMRRVFEKADEFFADGDMFSTPEMRLQGKNWVVHDLHEREGLIDELKREDLTDEQRVTIEDRIVNLDNRIAFILDVEDIPDSLREDTGYDFEINNDSQGVVRTEAYLLEDEIDIDIPERRRPDFGAPSSRGSEVDPGTGLIRSTDITRQQPNVDPGTQVGGEAGSTRRTVRQSRLVSEFSKRSKRFNNSAEINQDLSNLDIHTRVAARKLAAIMDNDPDLVGSVVIHKDDQAVEDYLRELRETSPEVVIPDGVHSVRGMYIAPNGEIHINADRVKAETPTHEYAHAVMLGLESNNPDVIDSMYSRLVTQEGFPTDIDGDTLTTQEKTEAIADFFGERGAGVTFMRDQRSMQELFRAVRDDLSSRENLSLKSKMLLKISDTIGGSTPTTLQDPKADDAIDTKEEMQWDKERMGILGIKFRDAINRGASLNAEKSKFTDFEPNIYFSARQARMQEFDAQVGWYRVALARGEKEAENALKRTFNLSDKDVRNIKREHNRRMQAEKTMLAKVRKVGKNLKSMHKANLLRLGALNKGAKEAVDRAEGTQRRELLRANNARRVYEKAVNDYNKNRPAGSKYDKALSEQYLTTNDVTLKARVPKKIAAALDDIRAHIDRLSDMYAKDDIFKDNIKQTIKDGEGTYMARSYKAFWDPNYEPEATVKENAIQEKFRQDYGKPIPGYPNLKPGDAAYEKQLTLEAAREIQNILDDAAKVAKKGPGFNPFKERNEELDKWYRELLGEETDAMRRYLATVDQGVGMYTRKRKMVDVINAGMFPTDPKDKIFFESAMETGNEKAVELDLTKNQLEDITSVLGVDFTQRKIYAEPAVADALKEAFGSEVGFEQIRKLLMTDKTDFQSANYLINFSKTVLSYPTHAKNVFGNAYFALSNGWVMGTGANFKDSLKATFVANGITDAKYGTTAGSNKLGASLEEAIDFMIQEGVMQNDVRMGVLEAISQNSGNLGNWIRRREDAGKTGALTKAVKGAKRVGEIAQTAYQAEDDVWKVIGFLTERARYSQAVYGKDYHKLTNVQKTEISQRAASIVKDVIPNYSKLGRAQQVLAKSPVIGNFLAFRSEAIRTTANSIQLSFKELADPNNKIKSIGARRLAGNMAAASASALIVKMLSAAVGDLYDELKQDGDPKLMETISFMAPDFNKFGGNAILRTDNPNVFTLMDVTATDPKSTFYDAVMAGMLAKDVWDGATNIANVAAEGFLDETILAGKIREALLNENSYGNPIVREYKEREAKGWSENAARRVWHVAEQLVVNPSIKSAKKFMDSESKVNEGLAQVTGMRSYEVDVRDQYYYAALDVRNQLQEISTDVNRIMNGDDEEYTPEEKATALKNSLKFRLLALNDLRTRYEGYVALGATPSDLQQRLSRSGKDDVDSEGNLVSKAISLNTEDREYIFGRDRFTIPSTFRDIYAEYLELGLITEEDKQELLSYERK